MEAIISSTNRPVRSAVPRDLTSNRPRTTAPDPRLGPCDLCRPNWPRHPGVVGSRRRQTLLVLEKKSEGRAVNGRRPRALLAPRPRRALIDLSHVRQSGQRRLALATRRGERASLPADVSA
jgi:hypothetical protein